MLRFEAFPIPIPESRTRQQSPQDRPIAYKSTTNRDFPTPSCRRLLATFT